MRTDPNLQDPDAFYAGLVRAHEGLSETQSFEFNARLIFLLANQIGDAQVLADCLAAAVERGPEPQPDSESGQAVEAANDPANEAANESESEPGAKPNAEPVGNATRATPAAGSGRPDAPV